MEPTLSLAEAASRSRVSKPTVRARLVKHGHDPDSFRGESGGLHIPVSVLLASGLTLHGPEEPAGDGSGENPPDAPGRNRDGGDVLAVRLEASEALAAERLERVRFLERELERRHDELGALRIELHALREVLTGPKALPGPDRRWGFRRGQ
jgi:hypothetical protein